METLERASDDGMRGIVLNFEGLEYMSSRGIGLFVKLLIRSSREELKPLACGLSEHHRSTFQFTCFDDAIEIHDTEERALAGA